MDKRSNAANHNLCHFSFSDGRRCRMLRHRDHPGLCPFHSREERQRLESERIGTELAATFTGNYLTATDINHVLGKVFTALAQDRISVKKARALCYAAQLMLATLQTVRGEYQFKYSFDSWERMLKNSVRLPDPPAPIEDEYSDAEEPVSAAPEDVNVAQTFKSASSIHKTDEMNDDTTEEPALAGVGPNHYRGS
jgi:hypothetical protein